MQYNKVISVITACMLCFVFSVKVSAEDTATTEVTVSEPISNMEYKMLTEEEWYSAEFTNEDIDLHLKSALEKNGVNGLPVVNVGHSLGKNLSYQLYLDLFSGDPNAEAFIDVFGAKVGVQFGEKPLDDYFDDYNAENPVETSLGVLPSFSFDIGNGYTATYKATHDYTNGTYKCPSCHEGVESIVYGWYLTDENNTVIDTANGLYHFGCVDCGYVGKDYSSSGYTVSYMGLESKADFSSYKIYTSTVPEDWQALGTGEPVGGLNSDPLPVFYVGDDGEEHQGYIIGDTVYDMNGNPITNATWRYDFDRMPSEYLNDLYNAFMLHMLEDEYGQDIKFDDSGIIKAIKSVYEKLQAILSEIKKISARIKNNVSDTVEITEEFLYKAFIGDTEKFNRLELYDKLALTVENKFAFVTGLTDFINLALEEYKDTSETPVIAFDFNGRACKVAFDFIPVKVLDTFRYMLAAFLYLSFAFNTYRRVPSYINNGGDR